MKDSVYHFPKSATCSCKNKPIIIGFGPAGMLCAYLLAQHGYKPLVFERGSSVEERTHDITTFWETGVLNTQSNVQFGEGGAGTFSDGKLNTLVKDEYGRNKKVLEIFVENGAPKDILYSNKPHIGTDILVDVVRNMRNRIIEWGGEIHFHSQFIDFEIKDDKTVSLTVLTPNATQNYDTDNLVLAIGHSARDTFELLYHKKLPIIAKPFAVGVRVEHKQSTINNLQYGENSPYQLPAAAYKVTANLPNGRGVYSFCMCPGGYVVNASSEEGYLAVNGMSYHARDGINANSAIIVTVSPNDYKSEHPLAGVAFQRMLEKKAFEIGNGKIPVQTFGDFCLNKKSEKLGSVQPQCKGAYSLANVREIFSDEIAASIELGIKTFDKQLNGFSDTDTIISGVESRTSSPIRITRNDDLQVDDSNIYPCGEGAGYAGGIMSAAMDGIKVAEKIASKYRPFD